VKEKKRGNLQTKDCQKKDMVVTASVSNEKMKTKSEIE